MSHRLEIVSATWGTVDVTAKLRELYLQQSVPFTITPTDALLGPDPNINTPYDNTKVLVVYWRVWLFENTNIHDYHGVPSELQATTIIENTTGTIDYDRNNLPPPVHPASNPNRVLIAKAFWWNMDVTNAAQMVADDVAPSSEIIIGCQELYDKGIHTDPKFGTFKSISVVWSYVSSNGDLQYFTNTGTDQRAVAFRQGPAPPRLTIWGATYGGVVVTNQLVRLVDPATQKLSTAFSQTLPDTWPGNRKTLVVLYQYEGHPLQLWLGVDGTEIHLTPDEPNIPERTKYFYQEATRRAGQNNVIAMVWGKMDNVQPDVLQWHMTRLELDQSFTASNAWFDFDGWVGVPKSATVFYQPGVTGQIKTLTLRENPNEQVYPDFKKHVVAGDPISATESLFYHALDREGVALQVSRNGQERWVSVDTNNHVLIATDRNEDAALLSIMKPHGRPFLAVRPRRTADSYYYIRVVDPATPNPTLSLTVDPKEATEAYAEFPIRERLSLLFSFNVGHSDGQPLVLRYDQESDAIKVSRFFPGASVVPGDNLKYDQFIFKFDFVTNIVPPNEPSTTNDPSEPIPFVVFEANILIGLLFNVPNLVLGWRFSLPESATRSVIWWARHLKVPEEMFKIRRYLRSLRAEWIASPDQAPPPSQPGPAIWQLACEFAREVYLNSKFFDFYDAIFSTSPGVDYKNHILRFAAIAASNPRPPFDLAVTNSQEFTNLSRNIIELIYAAE
ncbi:hypothetical protein VTJ04DRAFT_7579 [Mycothermus thermophilus]|uniref:uncharacterized protein n=1 Tax=Humicola insolens TaxID=85995 RepID=UPI003743E816